MEKLSDALVNWVTQPRVGVMATIRKDGMPSQSAVWYMYDADTGDIRLSLTESRVKYKHLQRDPRMSLAVCGNELPYVAIVFEGTATHVEEDGHEFFRRLSSHYYGEDEGLAYAEYSEDVAEDNRVVMLLRVEKVRSWNFAVEDDYHRPWKESEAQPVPTAAPAISS